MNSGTVNSGCATNRANRLCSASSSSARGRSGGAVPAGQRAQGQGDRRAQEQQQRRDQRQDHVLGHVHAEQHHAVAVEPGAGDREQRGRARRPGDGPPPRPGDAGAAQPQHGDRYTSRPMTLRTARNDSGSRCGMEHAAPGRRLAGHPHAGVLPVVHRRLPRCRRRRGSTVPLAPGPVPSVPGWGSALFSRGRAPRGRRAPRPRAGTCSARRRSARPRHAQSASSTRPPWPAASASSVTTTCAERTGSPEVIVQACRSWTPRTPSTRSMWRAHVVQV